MGPRVPPGTKLKKKESVKNLILEILRLVYHLEANSSTLCWFRQRKIQSWTPLWEVPQLIVSYLQTVLGQKPTNTYNFLAAKAKGCPVSWGERLASSPHHHHQGCQEPFWDLRIAFTWPFTHLSFLQHRTTPVSLLWWLFTSFITTILIKITTPAS